MIVIDFYDSVILKFAESIYAKYSHLELNQQEWCATYLADLKHQFSGYNATVGIRYDSDTDDTTITNIEFKTMEDYTFFCLTHA